MGMAKGFGVTFRQMFRPRVTTSYPDEKRPKPERFHGRHVLNRYEDGMEKCIGCELCAGVCPAQCIYVRGADNPPDAPVSPGERYGFVYEINYLRCIHCDLCVEACPTEAITETKLFEFSFRNREDAIYTKSELLVGDDGRARRMPWELWMGGEDDHTSAWMRATSPSGDVDYEGRVAWSGELGFGERLPEDGQRPPRRAGAAGAGAGLMEFFLFFLFAGIALVGALGVVLAANPVHSALSLVTVLVSIAALFVVQDAQLLAAVQVIVYAGAIVVLFLFVIMLLGVDRSESTAETLRFQRTAALVLGAGLVATLVALISPGWATGEQSTRGVVAAQGGNIKSVAQSLFTTFLWPFELTAVLLVIAVIGGVVLARRSHLPADEELQQLEDQDS